MTERLYYNDSYQRVFEARVVGAEDGGRRIYLDRTAFYPASGGQPADYGTLNGIRVVDAIDEDERIAHVVESPLEAERVAGAIDWARRFDHMQQHSGQHLLSAAFEELYGMKTVSFHLGAEGSTIDLETADARTGARGRGPGQRGGAGVPRRGSAIRRRGGCRGVAQGDGAGRHAADRDHRRFRPLGVRWHACTDDR
jgi:alanyl-tRNA synthetase